MTLAATTARIVLSAEDRASPAFKAVQNSFAQTLKSADQLRNSVGGLGGLFATLGGGVLVGAVRNAANFADELGKAAQRAGETVEEFSRLAYAARQADVDSNELAKGLRQLGSDAADGGKKLAGLGINIKDQAGNLKTNAQLFRELADVIAGTESPQRRAALAAQAMGEKLGPQLVPLLSQGSGGLKDLADEAERFGRVVNDKAVRAAEAFNDNLTRLAEAGSGVVQRLSGPLIESLANTSSYFIKVANDAGTARAALITFGAAVARTLGLDDVGRLESQAKANQNAIALTVKQIETFQKLADRGDSAAAARVASLRDQFARLQADGQRVTSALKSEAAGIDASVAPVKGAALDLSGGLPSRGGSGRAGSARSGASTPFTGLTYDEQIAQRVGKLFEDSDVTRAKEYADTLAKLDALYFDGAINGDLYDSAVKKLTGTTAEAGKASDELAAQQARLAQLLAGTASAALEEQRSDMLLLAAAFEKGTISARQFEEATTARLGLTGPEAQQTVEDFGRSLYDDVKNSMSQALRDTKNPIEAFGDTLYNVVVTRLTSGIATSFADALLGSGGGGGGLFSGAADFLGSLFSFDGGGYTGNGPRAGGLDGKGGYLAMLHPRETVLDHTKGQGGGTTVINIYNTLGSVASQSDVVAGMQTVRAQILGDLQRSARYGGALA